MSPRPLKSFAKGLPLFALVAVAGLVPAACAKTIDPYVGGPMIDGGGQMGWNPPVASTPAVAADEAGAPSASAVPSASASAPPSASGSTSAAPSASASVPVVAVEALDGAIDLAIKAQAVKDGPGMATEGQPGRETLAEGGHFNMIVTLQPGRCYSFFAFSPMGQVSQIEMKLLAPPLYNVEAGRSGAADKNMAIIGKGKAAAMCPLLPLAVPYRLDVTARKGAGRIGVYVYSRSK